MNFNHLEHSPNKYPAIELDMTNFMEHLSDEYICGKMEVKDGDVQINPRIIDCKTEDCTNLEEISVSGVELKREEKVEYFNVEFVVFY